MLLASGCASSVAPPAPDAAGLAGEWVLTFPDLGRQQPTMAIVGAQVSGSGGCNRFGGALEINGPALRFTNLSATEMACEGAIMTSEALFFEALSQARGASPTPDSLSLTDAAGDVVLQFARLRAHSDLDAITWVWASGPWNAEPPSLRIEANDATGFTGCNRWFGAVDRAEDRLTFAGIGQTKMACFGPAGAAEQQFLAALARVARYRIENATLRLLDEKGAEVLRLTAQGR